MSLDQVPEDSDQYMNPTNMTRPVLKPARSLPSVYQGNNSWEHGAEAAMHKKLSLQPE